MNTQQQPGRVSFFTLDEGVKAYFTLRNFLVLIGIYLLGYSSLIVSNFYYADDHVRRMNGGIAYREVGRVSSEYVIRLWNFSESMLDAAPLFQLYAILLLAGLSLMLCALLRVRRSYLTLAVAAFTGLFPLLYGNMVYTVDAPFMIASLLVAVFPFLCLNNKRLFLLSSFLAGFLVLTFYQLSFTAYYITWLIIMMDRIVSREAVAFKQFFVAAALFFAGMLIYKFSFPELEKVGAVKTGIRFSSGFIPGLWANFLAYLKSTTRLLDVANLVVIAVCVLFFALSVYKRTQRNIGITGLLVLAALLLIVVLTAGPYIYLAELPEMKVRYYIVFSFAIGLLAIYGMKSNYKIVGVTNVLILMYFLNLANGYGNALKAKNNYRESIYREFVYDFKHIVNDQPYELYEVRRVTGTRDPRLFNTDSTPYQGKRHHNNIITALIRDMDIGFDQLNLEAFIQPVYGKPELYDESRPFTLLMSRPEYDLYCDGRTAYKVIFKY